MSEHVLHDYFARELGQLESERISVGMSQDNEGLIRKSRALTSISQIALEKDPSNETLLLAFAGFTTIISGSLETRAKHGDDPETKKNEMLDRAHNHLRELDPYNEALSQIDHTFHGPTIWSAEIYRNLARIYARRPNVSTQDLIASIGYYQLAVNEGIVLKTSETETKEHINAARSVAGVATVEVAHTLDILRQKQSSLDTPEINSLILSKFIEGRDLVWQTRDISNYDRIYATEERVLQYLLAQKISPTDSALQTTIVHMATLAKESPQIRKKIVKRLKGLTSKVLT